METLLLALAVAVAVLASFGACGMAFLGRFAPDLDDIERLVYGVPLGNVLASLALLIVACVAGLNAWLVVTVAAVGLALWLPERKLPSWPRGPELITLLVVGAFGLRWLIFWSGALHVDGAGLWATQKSIWADGAQHLGDITSFAYGDNFPPRHPRFPGTPFNYHYLTSITTAGLVQVGLTPWTALDLHSLVFSVLIAVAIVVFARRLGLGQGAAATALILFLLGGGLAWWTRLGGGEVGPMRWLNVYFALVAPQRGFLYGIPLGLLTLRLLQLGLERSSMRAFIVAGAVAGLLPYAHLGTLLALALLTPFLIAAFPVRRWFAFLGPWALVAGPQVWLQQAGSAGAASSLRWSPGWVAPPQPWIGFWLANLGLFLPLLVAAFVAPIGLSPTSRRFLLAFQPLFVVSNLVIFQPWDWDNTKVLLWWYLAACLLVGALLAWAWRLRPIVVSRPAIVVVVLSLVLSGLIDNFDQAHGRERNLLLSAEEIELARRVRESTDPHALFVVGLQHNHPIPVLAGRRVLMSYAGWLWSQGIDSGAREREVRSILTLDLDAPGLIEKYGVGYVTIGPDERTRFGADPAAWRLGHAAILETEHYAVFSAAPSPVATSSTRAPRD